MDLKVFEEIGLTGAEIKVFVALLEVGSSTAGKIVDNSGLQNAVVHRAFHSLLEKGLITYVLEGKIKNYQAIEPKLLLNYVDEKRSRIEQLLPELEKKKNHQESPPQARIYQGIRGIKELLRLLLDTKAKEYISWGGPQKANDLLGDYFWEGFHRKRIENKITAKLLFHQSLSKWATELRKLKLAEVRLTKQGFEELTETIVCGNRVGIIVYLEKPFGFLIEEEKVSRSYNQFFYILWNQTKN